MSKQEAVLAYIKGSIGRREFIQRLSVAGVSAAAAVTYANALKPGSAAASGGATSGGLRRAFQEDDYGTATVTPTETPVGGEDEAILEAIAAVLNALIDALTALLDLIEAILEGLGITGPIAAAATSNIQQILANLQAQLDGLGVARVPSGASGVLALQAADTEVLKKLSDVFNAIAGAYSNLLSNSDPTADAKKYGPLAIVSGRHAAYFLTLLGENPAPYASEPAVPIADLNAALDAAG